MSESISLFQLMKTFVEAEDKNKSFEVIFVRFEPILNKYALMLKDIDLKYDLAADMYLALLKMPLHEERFKQDKFVLCFSVIIPNPLHQEIWAQPGLLHCWQRLMRSPSAGRELVRYQAGYSRIGHEPCLYTA